MLLLDHVELPKVERYRRHKRHIPEEHCYVFNTMHHYTKATKNFYFHLLFITNAQNRLVGGRGSLLVEESRSPVRWIEAALSPIRILFPGVAGLTRPPPTERACHLSIDGECATKRMGHSTSCSLLAGAWLSIIEESGPPWYAPPPFGSGHPGTPLSCTPPPAPPPAHNGSPPS